MPPLRQQINRKNGQIEGFLRFLSGSRGSREPLAAPTRAHRPSGAVIRRRCGRPQAVHRPRRPQLLATADLLERQAAAPSVAARGGNGPLLRLSRRSGGATASRSSVEFEAARTAAAARAPPRRRSRHSDPFRAGIHRRLAGPLRAFQTQGDTPGYPLESRNVPVNADSRHRWLRIDRAATARSPAWSGRSHLQDQLTTADLLERRAAAPLVAARGGRAVAAAVAALRRCNREPLAG